MCSVGEVGLRCWRPPSNAASLARAVRARARALRSGRLLSFVRCCVWVVAVVSVGHVSVVVVGGRVFVAGSSTGCLSVSFAESCRRSSSMPRGVDIALVVSALYVVSCAFCLVSYVVVSLHLRL